MINKRNTEIIVLLDRIKIHTHTKTLMFLFKIYPRKEWLVVGGGLSCSDLICPILLPAENDEPVVDDDDEYGILIFNGWRLLFNSWLSFGWFCWLIATSITSCCGVIFGTDWKDTDDVVSIGIDDDKRCCDISFDTWREIVSGDIRLIELLLLSKDENVIHKSVLGKRRVHLEK